MRHLRRKKSTRNEGGVVNFRSRHKQITKKKRNKSSWETKCTLKWKLQFTNEPRLMGKLCHLKRNPAPSAFKNLKVTDEKGI